jgi:hypothetical protein
MNSILPSANTVLVNPGAEAAFLERNPDKSLKIFPLCYSLSPLQLCLEISVSSNSRNLLQFSVKEKGGKPYRIPNLLPYDFRNPYRNLKSENSQDYAQKTQ